MKQTLQPCVVPGTLDGAASDAPSVDWSRLDTGLLLHVMGFLDARTLSACCFVNHEWHQLAQDGVLWKALVKKDW
jgi:hypothetical protein